MTRAIPTRQVLGRDPPVHDNNPARRHPQPRPFLSASNGLSLPLPLKSSTPPNVNADRIAMSSSNSWSYSDSFSSSRRSRQHGVFTFWVPVVLTTTLVIGGAAAWIWSQREEEDDDGHLSYGEDHTDNEHYGPRPPGAGGAAGGYESEGNTTTYTTATYGAESRYGESRAMGEKGGEETVVSRLTGGMIRRTPSPQQVFDVVSKRTAAGMAAAGAAVTGALSSIREEGNNGNEYEDHSRWSEEQILRRQLEVEARSSESASAVATNTEAFGAAVRAGASERDNKRSGARKTVAVVVSADTGLDNNDLSGDDARGGFGAEHAVSRKASYIDPVHANTL